jgi:hypothetical protein
MSHQTTLSHLRSFGGDKPTFSSLEVSLAAWRCVARYSRWFSRVGSNWGVRKLMKARASAPLVVTNNKGKTQWFANYPSFAR